MNTLKRLSWNNSSDHLQLPTGARSPRSLSSPQGPPLGSNTSSYPFPAPDQASKAPSIEHITLHKSLDALQNLIVGLDEYRKARVALARSESALSKAQKDLQKCFSDKMEEGARDKTICECWSAPPLCSLWVNALTVHFRLSSFCTIG